MDNIKPHIDELKKLGLSDYVFLHSAALFVCSANNNVFCDPFDVLVSENDIEKLKTKINVEEEDDRFISSTLAGVKFRFWKKIAGYAFETIPKKTIKGRTIPEPKLLLDDVLDECPELYLLIEQRARLASIIYFDEMSDEEINLFRRYVRQT